MNVKEAIRALSCFDENQHIVVKYENECRDLELEIIQITFDGRNCVVESADD